MTSGCSPPGRLNLQSMITFPDRDHSGGEEREITIGYTAGHQVVFVTHCQRGDRLRIISARKATRRERRQYEEGIGKEFG